MTFQIFKDNPIFIAVTITMIIVVVFGSLGVAQSLKNMDDLNNQFIEDHKDDNCSELQKDSHQFDSQIIKPIKYNEFIKSQMEKLKC